jgi:hypothetical protein
MQAGQEEVQSAEAVLLQILSKSKDFGEIGNPATDFLPRPNPAENQIKPKKSPAPIDSPRIASIRCTVNSDLIPAPDGVRKEEPRRLRQKRFLWR